jgi:hypothetical protein
MDLALPSPGWVLARSCQTQWVLRVVDAPVALVQHSFSIGFIINIVKIVNIGNI